MFSKILILTILNLESLALFLSVKKPSDYDNFSNGLKIIIESTVGERPRPLNIVHASFQAATLDFRDYFVKYLMDKSKVRIRQMSVNNTNVLAGQTTAKYLVLITENIKDFSKFHSKLTEKNFDYQGFIFIALIKGKIIQIQEIFEKLWTIFIQNVVVVYENEDTTIDVLTFLPFRSMTDCSNVSPVIINKLINRTFVNGISNFFPNKMKDLQKCPIRIAIAENFLPHIAVKTLSNGTRTFKGREYDVLVGLSQSINFTLNFTVVSSSGYIFENGSAGGALQGLLKKKADISIGNWWLRLYRMNFFDATSSYISEKIIFIIPSGSELSSFEKLMYPLQLSSWLVFISFIVSAFAVIFITNRMPEKYQHFIYGENVNYPYLNVVIGILGVSQNRLPVKSFSRFLLMSLLLMCLVIRTAYQGKMFQLMKLNMKHSEPSTMEEILKANYDFYVPDFYADMVRDKNTKTRIM